MRRVSDDDKRPIRSTFVGNLAVIISMFDSRNFAFQKVFSELSYNKKQMMSARHILAPFLCVAVFCCADEPSTIKSGQPVTITFYDSDGFDSQLSSAMRSGNGNISVNFVGSVSPNALPSRLGSWLAEVQESDGKVVVEKTGDNGGTRTRSIDMLGVIPGLLQAAYSYIHNRNLYGPASSYDASLLVVSESAQLQEITFRHREP